LSVADTKAIRKAIRRQNKVKLALFSIVRLAKEEDVEPWPDDINDLSKEDRELLERVSGGLISLWDALNG
jgi:hypothetical protein